MINKEIIINKKTRAIVNGENGDIFKLGVDSENLQENIVFKFEDEFVNGTARVEIIMQNNTKSYIMIDKVNETYVMPVKSVLTKKGLNKMQLVITQGTNDQEIPIFKSEMFNFFIGDSINADTEQPEEYPQWIDKANTTLNEIDNFDIDAVKELNEATITITDRTGLSKSVKVYDGNDGINGKDAKINGVNTLSLKAGTNITLDQQDDELTINAEGGSGGGAVNSVNGMTGDVVIDIPVVPTNVSSFNNDSGYINKNVNDLTYYTKTTDLPTIPTNISAFNNDVGYLTQHQDISGKQDKIDSSNKLSADLVDDTSSTNKFTNATEKATWNAKSDFSGSYNDLTNLPNLNDYQAQYRVNNSTTKFNFDTEKLGFYVFSGESTNFYYRANNYETYASSIIPLFMFYTKLVSEAEANEEVGTLIYINDSASSSNANRGMIYKCSILQSSNEAVWVAYKASLTGDRKTKFLTNNTQQIDGTKTFNNLPKLSSYSAPTNNEDLVAKKYVDDNIAKYSTMPTASSSYENQIAQFIGTTNSTYTNGYFYKCINNSGTYSWKLIDVEYQETFAIDTNSTSDPFVFEGKKKGIYTFNTAYDQTYFYYKIKNSDTNYSTLSVGQVLQIWLYDDFDYDNAQSNDKFGMAIIKNTTQGTIGRYKISKTSNFIATSGSTYYIVLTNGTQTISGVKIFGNIPQLSSYTTPTNDAQLVAKKYVDDSIASAITTTLGGNY